MRLFELDTKRRTFGIRAWFSRHAAAALLWAAPAVFLIVFYFYPLERILLRSLQGIESGGFRLVFEALISPGILKIIAFTFWQAALSTLLTLIIGLPGAYLLARYNFPGKALFRALTGIPFVMPTLVVAAAFNALLGSRGWINLALMEIFDFSNPPINFTNTLTAILIAHVFYNTTLVLRIVGDFWSHLDPRLGQAAQVLGANRWQALRHVTLPLLEPATLAAAMLVFIFDFTSFGVILILGGPKFATLEVEIYYQTVSLFNLPMAATLSLLQLVFTLILTILYTRLNNRLNLSLQLKPQAYTQNRLSSWRKRLTAGGILAFLILLQTIPLAALGLRSITRLESDRSQQNPLRGGLTFDFYRALSENPRQSLFYVPPIKAIGYSLGYASATVALALALGIPAAWALTRFPESPATRLMDPLLMLPLGTSAVTLGLGFIIALNRPPLDLRSSPALVPLAHSLVALPFVVRSLSPALRSIRPRLRHAAAVLGANPLQVLRTIDLPLVGRALLVAMTFAFTISLGEFGATALIARPEFPTITLMIYRFISQPGAMNYGQALALSTILMTVCAAGILLIERIRIGEAGEF